MDTTTSWLLTEQMDATSIPDQENGFSWFNDSTLSVSTFLQPSDGFNSTALTELNGNATHNSFWSVSVHTAEPPTFSEVSGRPASFFILVAIRSVVLLVTFLANVLVLYVYATTRKLRTYTNYFIVHLAVADLVSGGVIPLKGVYMEFSGDWPFGEAACTCYTYVDHIFLQATFLVTLAICYDRFRATNTPLKHLKEKTRRHARLLMLMSYLVPVLLWTPIIVILPYAGVLSRVRPPACHGPYAFYPALLVFTILALSWLPMSATVILYAFVYCAVIRKGIDRDRLTGKQTVSEQNQSRKVASETKCADPRLARLDAETCERASGTENSTLQGHSGDHVDSISAGLQGLNNATHGDPEEDGRCYRNQPGPSGPVPTETTISVSAHCHRPSSMSVGLQGLVNPAFEDTQKDNYRARDQLGPSGSVLTETTFSTSSRCHGNSGSSVGLQGHANLVYVDSEEVGGTSDQLGHLGPVLTETTLPASPRRRGRSGSSTGLQGQPDYEASQEVEDGHRARNQQRHSGAPVLTEATLSASPRRRASPGASAARVAGRAWGRWSRRSSLGESRVARLRATRTLTYICIIMLVSALPWSVFALWAAVDPLSLPLSQKTVFNLLGWLAHLSSALNPFCYAVGNPLFKAAFLRVLRCRQNTALRNTDRSSGRLSNVFRK